MNDSCEEARNQFDGSIRADENIVWYGRPDPTQYLWDHRIVPLGILATIGIVIALVEADLVLKLGIAVTGTILALGYMLTRYRRALTTKYAITSEFILIIEGKNTKRYAPDSVDEIVVYGATKEGIGNVTFTQELRTIRGKGGTTERYFRVGFECIPKVNEVAKLIEEFAS